MNRLALLTLAAVAVFAADPPMVPPAGPGVFTVKPAGPGTFKLTVSAHALTARADVEKYLAYRAARHTIEQGGDWFTFTEERANGESAEPIPRRDPEGRRFSFRLKYFRPVWRYKVTGATAWTRWSPFTATPFPILDSKTITDFELTAQIVVRKGPMDDADPLAFEAWPLSDLLINQVSPPK